jgi:excisionase family DNA binding protein
VGELEPAVAEADPFVLTIPEAAGFLRISKELAYALAREGKLPTVRLGRRVVVPRDALLRWMEAHLFDPENLSGRSVSSNAEDKQR